MPTDGWRTWWLFVLASALVPLGATVASLVAMRRITISPFGVLHRHSHRPPATLPAVLFTVGVAGLILWGSASERLGLTDEGPGALGAVALLLFFMAEVGLVFGTAAFAYQIGALAGSTSGASGAAHRLPPTGRRAVHRQPGQLRGGAGGHVGSAVQGTRADSTGESLPRASLSTASIVLGFDPSNDREAEFLAVPPSLGVQDVLLKQREESLRGGVVAGRGPHHHDAWTA